MLKKETCEKVWSCYREIEAGEKLLEDLKEIKKQNNDLMERDKFEPKLKDAFGCRRDFRLGVPSGENGHRLFMVSPVIAESVIKAHLADKKSLLKKMQEVARLELIEDQG